MRSLLIALALLPCLVAASGCGTLGNIFAPRPAAHVYGGVEFDCLAIQSVWSLPGAGVPRAARSAEEVGEACILASLVALDFPLSIVGDTITLPLVLTSSGVHGWDLGQEESPAEHRDGPSQVEVPPPTAPPAEEGHR